MIYGETIQKEEPTPEYPKKIINKQYIEYNGKKIYVDNFLKGNSLKEGEYIFKGNDGKWYKHISEVE